MIRQLAMTAQQWARRAGDTFTAVAGLTLAAAAELAWTGRTKLVSTADGYLTLLNAAGSDFSLLRFGGTTSSFPAIKRSSDSLQVRKADDSNFANMRVADLNCSRTYLNTTTPLITGTGTPEGAVTASVGALFLRTDGGTSTTLYIKESGTGNTGWVAK